MKAKSVAQVTGMDATENGHKANVKTVNFFPDAHSY